MFGNFRNSQDFLISIQRGAEPTLARTSALGLAGVGGGREIRRGESKLGGGKGNYARG